MSKADENYKAIKQHAHYTNLSSVNQSLVSKFESQNSLKSDTYFMYGTYIDENKVSMDVVTGYFVTVMQKPKKPYVFVYYNDFNSGNGFNSFKNMLSIMPIEYFTNLQAIYLVRPTLRMKAARYFAFGTINKFINNKTIDIDSIEQLSKRLQVNSADIFKFMTLEVRNHYSNEQIGSASQVGRAKGMFISSPLVGCNNTDRISTHHAGNHVGSHVGKVESILQKSGGSSNVLNDKMALEQFSKSERGIPEAFQVLIHYFREHKDQLEEEGIFRKSVNIEDETLAIEEMKKKNYDVLEKFKDSHLVASTITIILDLIKRFMSKLKVPIIPYKIFHTLMDAATVNAEVVGNAMKTLHCQNVTNYLTLSVLIDFLKRKIVPLSNKNKMTAQNISICFAPCLMWAEQRSIKDLAYINKSVNVVMILIENFEEIFGTKKQMEKLFRSSYFETKKKRISQTYNISEVPESPLLNDKRNTPNFGALILQKTHNQLKSEDYSDISADDDQPSTYIKVQVLTPSKNTKSQAYFKQAKEQFDDNERKSDQPPKNENQTKLEVQPQGKKRGIFSSAISSTSSQQNKQKFDVNVSPSHSNISKKSVRSDLK